MRLFVSEFKPGAFLSSCFTKGNNMKTNPNGISAAELAEGVGNLTFFWNDIHLFVYAIFVRLMDGDYTRSDAIFFALKSDKNQRDFTARLAKAVLTTYPEVTDKICRYLDDAGNLAGRRNAFIHAMWADRHSGKPQVFEPSSPKLAKADIKTELDKLISSCSALVEKGAELDELVEKAMKRKLSIERLAKAFAAALQPKEPTEATVGPRNHLNYLSDSSQLD
jgi:transcription termination factor NusB